MVRIFLSLKNTSITFSLLWVKTFSTVLIFIDKSLSKQNTESPILISSIFLYPKGVYIFVPATKHPAPLINSLGKIYFLLIYYVVC